MEEEDESERGVQRRKRYRSSNESRAKAAGTQMIVKGRLTREEKRGGD